MINEIIPMIKRINPKISRKAPVKKYSYGGSNPYIFCKYLRVKKQPIPIIKTKTVKIALFLDITRELPLKLLSETFL
jgi:hypothetical protein